MAHATIALLSDVSRRTPVLCLIDDAHLLDPESREVLGLIARRLHEGPVVMVFASDVGADPVPGLDAMEKVSLSALSPAECSELVHRSVGQTIRPADLRRLSSDSGGCPLALVEMAQVLTAVGVNDFAVLPDPLPPGQRIEAHFAQLTRSLPEPTQMLLVALAAEADCEPQTFWRVVESMHLPDGSEAPAIEAGLVRAGWTPEWIHPASRSAVYWSAPPSLRRRVHNEYTKAFDPAERPDRHAWHLSKLASDTNGRRQIVGVGLRVLADGFDGCTHAPTWRGHRAIDPWASTTRSDRRDRGGAEAQLIDALTQRASNGRRATPGYATQRPASNDADVSRDAVRPTTVMSLIAQLHDDDTAAMQSVLRGALETLTCDPITTGSTRLAAVLLASETWNSDALLDLALDEVAFDGGPCSSAVAVMSALHCFRAGRLDHADVHVASASNRRMYRETGLDWHEPISVLLDCWRGDEGAVSRAELLLASARETDDRLFEILALDGIAWNELALGDYAVALRVSRRRIERTTIGRGQVFDMIVEAAMRVGDVQTASDAAERLQALATTAGTAWARGVATRAAALVADDALADDLFCESIGHLERTPLLIELARSRLLHGEWLRRSKRRIEARRQLDAAHAAFAQLDAHGFARRAQRELQATGPTARRRNVDSARALTPQEREISTLASVGATNREIATRLYLSTSTVDYHLRKVFQKLGVTSRRELGRALGP